tara:strand:+ start:4612 stop:4914 length:303 start_codon:yes stop_codon:yes gene_type:complete
MKQGIFYQYVERITDLFQIKSEDLFSKNKRRDLVDARHLLYYLCTVRHIPLSIARKYMADNGYIIPHQSIAHGIKQVKRKLEEDKDYVTIVKDIDNAVFI